MVPKKNHIIRLLDNTLGVILKVRQSYCIITTGKNVKKIRLSAVELSGYERYDYFQLNIQRSNPKPAACKKIPLKTLAHKSARADSYISTKVLNKAIAAFDEYCKILSNVHKTGVFAVEKKLQRVVRPFLKKGFCIRGHIEGRDRVLILTRGGKQLKAYKLPIGKTKMEGYHG